MDWIDGGDKEEWLPCVVLLLSDLSCSFHIVTDVECCVDLPRQQQQQEPRSSRSSIIYQVAARWNQTLWLGFGDTRVEPRSEQGRRQCRSVPVVVIRRGSEEEGQR